MNAVITTTKLSTRFFLTEDRLATDIPERALTRVWTYDAQTIADKENTDPQWTGFSWQVAMRLHNGELA